MPSRTTNVAAASDPETVGYECGVRAGVAFVLLLDRRGEQAGGRIGSVAMKDIRQEVHARVKASGTVAHPTAPGV
jgi:hypothetical protein